MTTMTAHALSALLDTTWLSKHCGRPVRATALRIKPDTSILAALQNHTDGRFDGWARFMWPAGHTKAHKLHEWARAHGYAVETTKVFRRLVFQHGQLETDPKLGPTMQPDHLGFHVGEFDTILRYNPARRIVYRDAEQVIRITVAKDTLNMPVYQHVSQAIPTPVRLDDGGNPRVSIMQAVGDATLEHSPTLPATMQAGRILAQLHMSTPTLARDLADRLYERYDTFPHRMEAHARIFSMLAPELANRIVRLSARIPTMRRDTPVLVHGDASPDQFLVYRHNADIWLTDFDRAHLNPAACDLGSYLSTVDEQHGAALLEGYANTRGFLPRQSQIRIAQLQATLLRVAEPMRSGDPEWRSTTANTLSKVEELL